jgi:hypothetical protein
LNRTIQGAKETSHNTRGRQEAPKIISSSRQSYTQQAENFGILVQLLETIPPIHRMKKN